MVVETEVLYTKYLTSALKNVVDMVYVCPVIFGKSSMGLELLY